MKAAQVILAILITAAIINYLRGGDGFPLPQALPMCDGRPFSGSHALGGIALLFLLFWGLRRLSRLDGSDEEDHI